MTQLKAKKVLSKAIGFAQVACGVIAIVFAFTVYYDVLGVRVVMGFSAEGVGFYLWVLIIFGILSVVSGLFLLYEP